MSGLDEIDVRSGVEISALSAIAPRPPMGQTSGMAPGRFRFERFVLDPADRRLEGADGPVELNGRYLDALVLLVREQGRLVSKDRFMDEVWRGVPVTDEALTQCIRTLRRQLGDSAGAPRFIETVPKHGYRFIAPVEAVEGEPATAPPPPPVTGPAGYSHRRLLTLGGAGIAGGAAAGVLIGLYYGFSAAAQPQPDMGAASVVLVLISLCIVIGVLAGAGVGFGIAAASFASERRWPWSALGGALGGLFIGAFVKLLGLDAFSLLTGQSPGAITGGPEGALVGFALGLGAWLGRRAAPDRIGPSVAAAGLAGGLAGLAVPLLGGRLMGGSLDLLAQAFPSSRLRLPEVGGPVAEALTAAMEGAVFGLCLTAAMALARRTLPPGEG
jgi:DNA-binding winged helix-turn-helix (wHTH) protein